MSEIRLFYHGPNKNQINFGDALSPIIVNRITGKKVIYSSILKCELIAIGSILDIYFRWRALRSILGFNRNLVVWGSGFIKQGRELDAIGLSIAAVRGPNTVARLNLSSNTTMGDPGLLASMICQRKTTPRYAWGVVPHKVDIDSPWVKLILQNTKHSTLVRVDQDPMETLTQISECERIVSSSLHGLIIADSLGIPNWWMKLSDSLIGGGWKFNDYFLSVGKNDEFPIQIPSSGNLTDADLSSNFSYWKIIPKIHDNLCKSLRNIY